MRKIIVAEIGGREVLLTRSEADALKQNGFAHWIGFRRLKITTRFEAFTTLRDLSAKVGEVVVTARREPWIEAFIAQQFLRAERSRTSN